MNQHYLEPGRADVLHQLSVRSSAFTDDGETVFPLPDDAIEVRNFVKHQLFDISGEAPGDGLANFYDIGLVFLDSPILDLEPAIVMTPEESADLAVGDSVRIAGWGRRTVENSDQIGEKYCATTNIFEIGEFEMQIGRESDTSRKCHGDSGGPTYITIDSPHSRDDRVIGVTPAPMISKRTANCGIGGIDTMPSAWYQWIDETMSGLCESEERAWCEVPGVVPLEFYDEDSEEDVDEEEGGCGCTTSDNKTGFAVAFAIFLLMRLRRRNPSASQ